MKKTIDQAINETAEQLAGVINNSGLPLAVIKLLLTNTLYQLNQIPQAAPTTEEASDAEN